MLKALRIRKPPTNSAMPEKKYRTMSSDPICFCASSLLH